MKKVKKESGSSRIEKAEGNIRTQRAERTQKTKAIRDLCGKIVWRFDAGSHYSEVDGPYVLGLVDQKIAPWEYLAGDDDDKGWDRLYEAMKTSFGFGYALGQMLDIPDIDITPIKDFLRKERILLYLPRKKKAA